MGSQHQSLLIHTEVRRFSRGEVLARLFELNEELQVFIMAEDLSVPGEFAEFLRNEKWPMRCAYLADIFGKLNEVSLSLQGKAKTVFTYFPDNKDINCVQNTFANRSKPAMPSVPEYGELVEIQCSSALKTKFESVPLDEFWVELKKEHPSVAEKATLVLLPFVSIYRCESGFSSYTYTKNKFSNWLDAAPDLCIQLSNIKPNFKTVLSTKMKQFQSSH
ncbi:hypothetical protein PR048_007199 [Dryococelus australis]|uniref:Uncharacterized protein n=1 Tax=Dryococelus australis TaxID=614101 RepID=A0ABQ9ICX8_9NEOP|nr:hypothetical protein PR048_007199 [Dryococelus australis]